MKRGVISVFAVIAILGVTNLLASALLGLGDAEALYYCYGRHPSLSYLDHPPLIGWLLFFSTSIGGPSIFSVRLMSLSMAILAIVFTYFLTRDIFGTRAAGWSSLLLLATPVFSIGTIAATPDSALVALWPLFTWQLYLAGADERVGKWTRFGRPVLLGVILGLAFLTKYTGACLVITACMAVASPVYKKWRWRPGLFWGALTAALVATPVFVWNIQNDFAGLYHRLVWTQSGSGFSLRNVGALLGGQLLYIGPLMLVLMGLAGIHYWKKRQDHPGPLLLLQASIPALAATYLLTMWSDVAEPHWPGVAYMPLFAAAGGFIVEVEGKALRLAKYTIGFGLIVLAALNIVILTPLLPALSRGDSYQREYDLGNELRGWPEVAEAIRELNPDGKPVVAAFYTQCSQLFFALGRNGDPPVRCISEETDDFDLWYPEFEAPAGGVIFVTDNRFDFDPVKLLPKFKPVAEPKTVEIFRAGTCVREFEIWSLALIRDN